MNLINVDELLSKLEKMKQSFMEKQQTLHAHIIEYTIRTVKSMPTVEAVQVVRCKDCKYFQLGYANKIGADGLCDNTDKLVDSMDFCSDGTKMDREDV